MSVSRVLVASFPSDRRVAMIPGRLFETTASEVRIPRNGSHSRLEERAGGGGRGGKKGERREGGGDLLPPGSSPRGYPLQLFARREDLSRLHFSDREAGTRRTREKSLRFFAIDPR